MTCEKETCFLIKKKLFFLLSKHRMLELNNSNVLLLSSLPRERKRSFSNISIKRLLLKTREAFCFLFDAQNIWKSFYQKYDSETASLSFMNIHKNNFYDKVSLKFAFDLLLLISFEKCLKNSNFARFKLLLGRDLELHAHFPLHECRKFNLGQTVSVICCLQLGRAYKGIANMLEQ